jgi:hypothetical protein
MGLDAFITAYDNAEFDSKGRMLNPQCMDSENEEQLGYFRKVNWLHNYMQHLYAGRTGIDDPREFNCVHVVLDYDTLCDLQADIYNSNIVGVQGFFFGDTQVYPEQKLQVLEVIAKAIFALSQGKTVTYGSWW